MKNFSIELTNKMLPIEDKKFGEQYCGTITINGDKSIFYTIIKFWSYQEYQRQWQEGSERILTHLSSCIVLSVLDVGEFPLIEMLLIFRKGDIVHVQQRYLHEDTIPLALLNVPFTPETCYKFIGKQSLKNSSDTRSFKLDLDDFKVMEQ